MAASQDTHSDQTRRSPTWIAWLQLVRLPNVFTVLADVGAAFLLIGGGPFPVARLALILASGVSLYWAGMVLNDVFDLEKDKAERSNRPLAAGAIPVSQASFAGWGFLLVGVLLAVVSGYVPAEGVTSTWLPAAIALALAGLIVAYNGPLKKTPIAPAVMGGCRVLSFLLGASPVLMINDGIPVIPKYLLCAAFGLGVYIMGITTIARDEATGGHQTNLRIGFVVMVIGALVLSKAPELAQPNEREGWKVMIGNQFMVLIWLIVFPVVARGFRMQMQPDGKSIGNTIRAGILTIIPLSAAYALLGSGPIGAVAIFALLIPAIILSMRLRVT